MMEHAPSSLSVRPAICHRRADYARQLLVYGLATFLGGMFCCPPLPRGIDLSSELKQPLWWKSEARRGFVLLDEARRADSGGGASCR